jgi:hypothetical protein
VNVTDVKAREVVVLNIVDTEVNVSVNVSVTGTVVVESICAFVVVTPNETNVTRRIRITILCCFFIASSPVFVVVSIAKLRAQ